MADNSKRPLEELVAGDEFVKALIDRADTFTPGRAPLWHGWALMDAFLAGVDYARSQVSVVTSKPD